MNENLQKLNEAIKYAEDEKQKFEQRVEEIESASGSDESGDESLKELYDEQIEGLQKRITYLDGEIGKMKAAVEEIEKIEEPSETYDDISGGPETEVEKTEGSHGFGR